MVQGVANFNTKYNQQTRVDTTFQMASNPHSKYNHHVKPVDKTTRRTHSGQALTGLHAKRGGGGTYNWGNPLDYENDEAADYEDDCKFSPQFSLHSRIFNCRFSHFPLKFVL